MLSKCANPSCSAQFRYLHDGKVFRIDLEERAAGRTPVRAPAPGALPVSVAGPRLLSSGTGRRPEYFWLCGTCCEHLTLGADAGSVVLMPRPQAQPAARQVAAS